MSGIPPIGLSPLAILISGTVFSTPVSYTHLWSLAEFEVDVLDNNFIMAGFNTISGTAFKLKPDSIPPLLTTRNITIELLRNDTVLQVQQLVLSASDAEGGTIEYISVTPNTFSCIDIGTTKTVQVTISDGRCNFCLLYTSRCV